MDEQLKEKIMESLEEVVDPELGVDIVNLGLVYDVIMEENQTVVVTMTLTSIGCPLAGAITEDVKKNVIEVDGVENVEVNITFNPPWEKERMSRYAKIALGIQ
ncbi:metal-sulfur cluster assembly factor [Priestia flexa]|uniref:DNA methyltransferase n=2 Tax=Priestia TaxID=2800373 RepID=A0A0V8JMM6_9BACI|nr:MULTISPECIES: metal-sulfur cluster assembly factor [Bacillaceae]AQX55837.1 DNA methyltransferase [Priestia flexa]KSU88204.1 DNA methyltransferase [Priestia veravalensis]KZB91977.1 DNA methyltransferase [Bacillus sp. VT 712]MBN8251182.1 metal-sulfur cluster assembly factor [Priestia flexa]MBN8433386.1 metal-sulfur cluster assembly factor [Priestia flexa]